MGRVATRFTSERFFSRRERQPRRQPIVRAMLDRRLPLPPSGNHQLALEDGDEVRSLISVRAHHRQQAHADAPFVQLLRSALSPWAEVGEGHEPHPSHSRPTRPPGAAAAPTRIKVAANSRPIANHTRTAAGGGGAGNSGASFLPVLPSAPSSSPRQQVREEEHEAKEAPRCQTETSCASCVSGRAAVVAVVNFSAAETRRRS